MLDTLFIALFMCLSTRSAYISGTFHERLTSKPKILRAVTRRRRPHTSGAKGLFWRRTEDGDLKQSAKIQREDRAAQSKAGGGDGGVWRSHERPEHYSSRTGTCRGFRRVGSWFFRRISRLDRLAAAAAAALSALAITGLERNTTIPRPSARFRVHDINHKQCSCALALVI